MAKESVFTLLVVLVSFNCLALADISLTENEPDLGVNKTIFNNENTTEENYESNLVKKTGENIDCTELHGSNGMKKGQASRCQKVQISLNFNDQFKLEEAASDSGHLAGACDVMGYERLIGKTQVNLSMEDALIFRKIYPVWEPMPVETKSAESPLVLTDYIKQGRGEEGRRLARVRHPLIDPLVKTSYSGYFTVDEKYDSNLFFWFFPAQNDDTIDCLKKDESSDKPVILWLQGGPGVSSMFGLFQEIGPLAFDKQEKLVLNNYTWNKEYHLLFIDNPVGTGYSYTNHSDGFSTRQEEIGKNLYKALVQFFELFYEYQGSPFYLAGESYAGKHIPSVAYEIKKNNPEAGIFINLKGMAIGNGFTDPANQMAYSDFLLKMGLVEQESYHLMQIVERQAKYNLRQKRYIQGFLDWTRLLLVFLKSSGYKNMYHALDEREHDQLSAFTTFVQEPTIRRALHVGDTEFTSIGQVYASLIPDMMRSVKPLVDELIKEYRVMFYSGQLDLIVAYPLTHEGMFRDVAWGRRKFLRVGDRLAGYSASSGNLTLAMIRNAGHMVPADQPEWALHLIQSFIQNDL